MKIVLRDNRRYVLRFDRGEELISGLGNFCEENDIKAAAFWGIGACSELEVAWYDVDEKQYTEKLFKEKLEIVSLQGSASRMGNKLVIHAHGTFSNKKMEVVGGHVKRLAIAATGEIVLIKFDGNIEREYSDEIGLNLMRPPQ